MKNLFQISALTAALLFAAGGVQAGAVIINSAQTVAMGINDDGSLNTATGSIVSNSDRTGVAYNFGGVTAADWRDATSPGCYCEGWGVSAGAQSGYANVSSDSGAHNLTFGALAGVTGSTATATASITSLPGITVTQVYQPATNAPDALFRVHVTIANTTGADATDVRYVRVMDWDIPPTEFDEYVTIKGTATTTLLERSHNNGFNTANPLGGDGSITAATEDVDFTDVGINDHGAYFRFNFGTIKNGEAYEFDIFYGAAGNEADAISAIAAESIELYSLGQNSSTGAPGNDDPTFIFGFKGVGGTAVECGQPGQPDCPEPNPTPEPASLALLGLGLAGLGFARRRKS